MGGTTKAETAGKTRAALIDEVAALRDLLGVIKEIVFPPRPATPGLDLGHEEFCRLSRQWDGAFADLQRERAMYVHGVLSSVLDDSDGNARSAASVLRSYIGELPYPPRPEQAEVA